MALLPLPGPWGAGAQQTSPVPTAAAVASLRQGRELLGEGHDLAAERFFQSYLHTHPGDAQAELGMGDAQLGLKRYESAETTYRALVAQQPELWQAHKNLVVVEAALGRWEEFDRERTVLRLARERGAPGISAHESDVIDSFSVGGERWVVRAYFEPMGRSRALYNFERFSTTGRVQAYISLENAEAAQQALTPSDVRIGNAPAGVVGADPGTLALNWYTGGAHGTAVRYTAAEPSYERVRADAIRWLRTHQASVAPSAR